MKFINDADKEFWKQNLKKGIVLMGFTFFSTGITIGFNQSLINSLFAGGAYIFIEAMRKYNIEPQLKKGQAKFSFLF